MTSFQLYCSPGKEDLSLKLGDNKQFSEIYIERFNSLILTCRKLEIDGEATIRDAIATTLEAWNSKQVREQFAAEEIEKMDNHIESIPIASG